MSPDFRFLHTLLLVFLISGLGASRSQVMPDENNLDLYDKGKTIENSISFYIPETDHENLQLTDGIKMSMKDSKTIINGDTLLSEEISTRGGSTLLFRRKSFSFTVKPDASFRHGEQIQEFRKFYALSLSMDKNYCRNRLAYEMMDKAGLFNLFYSFSELHINGNSEGICMVIERPEDWAIKKENSPLIIRRGYYHNIDKLEYSKISEKTEAAAYKNYFSLIYKSLKKYHGEELYKTLSQWIDLENYMKWLAFNFLIHNGDYTDEVFFYIDPGIKKFKIIPWDYDDLFLAAPHEGTDQSRKYLSGKLLFSSEDQLDITIADDPYLYKIYLLQLKKLLEQLPAETLRNIFNNTYAELYPYYSNYEIIKMSRYDSHKETDIPNLENDLRSLYNRLIPLYSYYLDYLKSIN